MNISEETIALVLGRQLLQIMALQEAVNALSQPPPIPTNMSDPETENAPE